MSQGAALFSLILLLLVDGLIAFPQNPTTQLSDPTRNPNLQIYYPFDIDFKDYSRLKFSNAIAMGSSKKPVTLACENDNLPSHRCSCYANIVAPAYLNIPAVQFQKTDVSWAWSAKVPKQSVRQMMFTNWGAQQWQFTSYLDSSGCFGVQLRRNVPTDGYTNTLQYLVSATSSQCNLWNTWNDYDVTWSRKLSKLNIYINGVLKGSSTVSASMTSSYTSDMFIGNTETHQFGAKLDTVGNADSMFTGGVRDFRIYNTSEPQFQDRCKNSFGYWKKF